MGPPPTVGQASSHTFCHPRGDLGSCGSGHLRNSNYCSRLTFGPRSHPLSRAHAAPPCRHGSYAWKLTRLQPCIVYSCRQPGIVYPCVMFFIIHARRQLRLIHTTGAPWGPAPLLRLPSPAAYFFLPPPSPAGGMTVKGGLPSASAQGLPSASFSIGMSGCARVWW